MTTDDADADATGTARVEVTWTPHDAQRKILNADARYRVCACGRRFGKTEAGTMWLFTAAWNNPETLAWWVGPSYQTTEVAWEGLTDRIPEVLIASRKRTKPRALTLKNGSRIGFRSADSRDTLRGVGLDYLVLDEAAYQDEEVWRQVLRPTLADTGGEMMAISTPNGRNWFWEMFQKGRNPEKPTYASFQFPSDANPYLDSEIIEDARENDPEHVFRQEWLAEFRDESGGVFTNIQETAVEDYNWLSYDGEPPYVMGVDLARVNDYLVIVVLDAKGVLTHFERRRQESWGRFQSRIERVAEEYPPVECRIDATRDNKLISDLANAGVPVNPIRFTAQTKADLIETLATRLERGDLSLPADCDQLLHELGAYTYETTSSGNIRYTEPSGEKSDCVDALALAASEQFRERERAGFYLETSGGYEFVGNPGAQFQR